MKDLPIYIVRIQYKGNSLDDLKKKKKDFSEHKPMIRYLYVYAHEDFNARMSKAWRADAVATIYHASFKVDGECKASDVKGIWK